MSIDELLKMDNYSSIHHGDYKVGISEGSPDNMDRKMDISLPPDDEPWTITRRESNNNPLSVPLFIIPVLLLSLFVIGLIAFEIGNSVHLLMAGVKTNGTVVDHDFYRQNGCDYYAPIVEFEAEERDDATTTTTVTFHAKFDDKNPNVHPVGTSVIVLYNPKNPSQDCKVKRSTIVVIRDLMVCLLLMLIFAAPLYEICCKLCCTRVYNEAEDDNVEAVYLASMTRKYGTFTGKRRIT